MLISIKMRKLIKKTFTRHEAIKTIMEKIETINSLPDDELVDILDSFSEYWDNEISIFPTMLR